MPSGRVHLRGSDNAVWAARRRCARPLPAPAAPASPPIAVPVDRPRLRNSAASCSSHAMPYGRSNDTRPSPFRYATSAAMFCRRQAARQRGACGRGKGLIRVQAHGAHQQPVSVHRGVPVVAAEERWSQLPRRFRIGVAAHHVRNLVGIFAMHTIEREPRKGHRRVDVQGFRVHGAAVERGHRKNYQTTHRFTIA